LKANKLFCIREHFSSALLKHFKPDLEQNFILLGITFSKEEPNNCKNLKIIIFKTTIMKLTTVTAIRETSLSQSCFLL
jgi:hypothetical protein